MPEPPSPQVISQDDSLNAYATSRHAQEGKEWEAFITNIKDREISSSGTPPFLVRDALNAKNIYLEDTENATKVAQILGEVSQILPGSDLASDEVRIGYTALTVPPTNIRITETSGSEEISSLRSTTSTLISTGHSQIRIDMRLIFPNIKDVNEKLREIIAQFRVCPILPVESKYIASAVQDRVQEIDSHENGYAGVDVNLPPQESRADAESIAQNAITNINKLSEFGNSLYAFAFNKFSELAEFKTFPDKNAAAQSALDAFVEKVVGDKTSFLINNIKVKIDSDFFQMRNGLNALFEFLNGRREAGGSFRTVLSGIGALKDQASGEVRPRSDDSVSAQMAKIANNLYKVFPNEQSFFRDFLEIYLTTRSQIAHYHAIYGNLPDVGATVQTASSFPMVPVALNQLVYETVQESPTSVACTLSLIYFNYGPYLKNFEYKDNFGHPTADIFKCPWLRNYVRALLGGVTDSADSENTRGREFKEGYRGLKTVNPNPSAADRSSLSFRYPTTQLVNYNFHDGAQQSAVEPTTELTLVQADDRDGRFPSKYKTPIIRDGLDKYINVYRDLSFFGNDRIVTVEKVSVAMSNKLAMQPILSTPYPTVQYTGGVNGRVSIELCITGTTQKEHDDAMQDIHGMKRHVERVALMYGPRMRRNTKIFIANDIVNLAGIYAVQIEQITTQTEGPRKSKVLMNLIEFTVSQSEQERLVSPMSSVANKIEHFLTWSTGQIYKVLKAGKPSETDSRTRKLAALLYGTDFTIENPNGEQTRRLFKTITSLLNKVDRATTRGEGTGLAASVARAEAQELTRATKQFINSGNVDLARSILNDRVMYSRVVALDARYAARIKHLVDGDTRSPSFKIDTRGVVSSDFLFLAMSEDDAILSTIIAHQSGKSLKIAQERLRQVKALNAGTTYRRQELDLLKQIKTLSNATNFQSIAGSETLRIEVKILLERYAVRLLQVWSGAPQTTQEANVGYEGIGGLEVPDRPSEMLIKRMAGYFEKAYAAFNGKNVHEVKIETNAGRFWREISKEAKTRMYEAIAYAKYAFRDYRRDSEQTVPGTEAAQVYPDLTLPTYGQAYKRVWDSMIRNGYDLDDINALPEIAKALVRRFIPTYQDMGVKAPKDKGSSDLARELDDFVEPGFFWFHTRTLEDAENQYIDEVVNSLIEETAPNSQDPNLKGANRRLTGSANADTSALTATKASLGFQQDYVAATAAVKQALGAIDITSVVNQDVIVREVLKQQADQVWSMRRCFPAFRLYFIDNNNEEIGLFDEMYGYNSVLSIKLYRHKFYPSTLEIEIINVTGNLDTLRSRDTETLLEEQADKDGNRPANRPVFLGRDLDPDLTKAFNKLKYQFGIDTTKYTDSGRAIGWNNEDAIRRAGEDPVTQSFAEPRNYLLREGTMIMLKLGYTNKPSELETVFTGQIAEINRGSVINLVAQDYKTELTVPITWSEDKYPLGVIQHVLLESPILHLGEEGVLHSAQMRKRLGIDTPDGVVQARETQGGETNWDLWRKIRGGNFEEGILDGSRVMNNVFLPSGGPHHKWVVAQKSALEILHEMARHMPGFITDVRPYDQHGTVFFGLPSQTYNYTLNGDDPAARDANDRYAGIAIPGDDEAYLSAQDLLIAFLRDRDSQGFRSTFQQEHSHRLSTFARLSTVTNQILNGAPQINDRTDRTTDYGELGKIGGRQFAKQVVRAFMNLLHADESINYLVRGRQAALNNARDLVKGDIYYEAGRRKLNPAVTAELIDKYEKQLQEIGTRLGQPNRDIDDQNQRAIDTARDTQLKKIIAGLKDREKQVLFNNQASWSFAQVGVGGATTQFGIGDIFVNITDWRAMVQQLLRPMVHMSYERVKKEILNSEQQFTDVLGQRIEQGNASIHIPDLGIDIRLDNSGWQDYAFRISSMTKSFRQFITDFTSWLSEQLLLDDSKLRAEVKKSLEPIKDHVFVGDTGVPPEGFRPFRNYHWVDSYHHIIKNDIVATVDQMANKVRVKYPSSVSKKGGGDQEELMFDSDQTFKFKELSFDSDIRPQDLKVRLINEFNAQEAAEADRCAISNLAEAIRPMYRGELVLQGSERISPYDIVYVYDYYNMIFGPIEVEAVIQIFNPELGFVSVITPHACVFPKSFSEWSLASTMGIIGRVWNKNVNWLVPDYTVRGEGKLGDTKNGIGIIPLTYLGRPWVAGLRGAETKWEAHIETRWDYFYKGLDAIEKVRELFNNDKLPGK